jgi:cell division septum initiation protein DivIVA
MENLQQLKEDARIEFDKKFVGDQSYEVKNFIDSLITKAYETGKKEILEKVYERDYAQKTMENVIEELKLL